jgi:hypothetical protein
VLLRRHRQQLSPSDAGTNSCSSIRTSSWYRLIRAAVEAVAAVVDADDDVRLLDDAAFALGAIDVDVVDDAGVGAEKRRAFCGSLLRCRLAGP